jgi:hypothetical protein
MNAKYLKVGMKVKNGNTIVKVTSIPRLDKDRECFFSGIIVESKDSYYKDFIGKEFTNEFNSAFSYSL